MKKILYIFAATTLIISCKDAKTEATAEKNDGLTVISTNQFKTMAMEVGTPVEQDFDVTVKASGRIDVPPQNRAKITSFIGGYVKSTSLLVGNKVVKGQPLLTMENTEFLDIQKDYLEVAEQITYLKSEFERQIEFYYGKFKNKVVQMQFEFNCA